MGTATRAAYGNILKTEIYKNPKVVVLEADLGAATKSNNFKTVAPERYFDMGISEQDLMGTAAGFAAAGRIPIASTFAVFATGRAFEIIRNSICYPNLNVKICATHAGLTVGEDGGTHQAIEDISLMRTLPNMTVINPADAKEAEEAVKAAVEYVGPVYIRLGRAAVDDIHGDDYKFQWGKGEVLRDGSDVAIIATGIMVGKALEAAETLAKEGIQATVVNIHTIKPLDEQLIIDVARKTGKVVTAEEATVMGGLGSAVAETLARNCPTKQAFVGIQDTFGESGSPADLLKKYGLTADDIVKAAKSL
ncbi:transketolase family protein [Megasphaera hexanoica]|uniref:Transketolase family protein n=1 Tax=Megasphaera hexanoica TaxID=1675036 RepID=A0ABW7DR87_9FIRM|nr:MULTISPECIES: transketolase family protein [Megasphaera]AXB81939.1 transketolase [Megasphaera hexanoica]KUH57424.1 transketolase [Megasphaera sp. DJF_B143]MCI5532828.1 transketolase family protein [Caecibacter massiliensis]MDY2905500.1 transketolase family protein [Caecibacter massiliensis]